MRDDETRDSQFDAEMARLEDGLETATDVVAQFNGEISRLRAAVAATGRDFDVLEKGLSKGLARALDGLVLDGMRASDAMETVARAVINTTYKEATRPVTDHLAGVLTDGLAALLPFAKGGSFAQGNVMPFAKGGVVTGPTAFPMRRGTGLMGEAGPEAILPLARGADGRLGVQTQGGGRPVNIVMNIQTPDVQGFHRSRSQIAAQMTRALSQGQRNR